MDSAELLGRNHLFAQLDGDELTQLAAHAEQRRYGAGDLIVKEGEPGNSLFLVQKGGVNVTKSLEGHFLAFLGAGGCFGEMALFTQNAVRTANCVCAIETECLVLDKAALERFCLAHPAAGNKIYREIIRVLAERLQA